MNTAAEQQQRPLGSWIAEASGVLCSDDFPAGDRAKLRRMVPGEPLPAAFYRYALRHLPDGWENNQLDWITITAGMAIMAPKSHNRGQSVGTTLARSGFSEQRLERLLVAQKDVLRTLILRVARFLSAKGAEVDWSQLAELLLARDGKADTVRMKIAKDYFRTGRE